MAKLRDLFNELKNELPSSQVTIDKIGTVTVRGLTAGERDLWEQYIYLNKNDKQMVKNVRANLVCRCLIDPSDGSLVYSDSPADLEEISALPAGVVDKLYGIAQKLSGIGAEEKLEKN